VTAGLDAIADDRTLAARLRVSVEAVQLTRAAEVVDMHVDTFILPRISRYDVLARHRGGPFGRRFVGHVDVPRLRDGGLDGAMWSITTNPFRPARSRWRVFLRNLERLRTLIARSAGLLAEARTLREYREIRARGAHACLPAIQGLNAVAAAPDGVASIPDDAIVRATVVHLTNSVYGGTSSPLRLGGETGLTAAGRDAVRALNARRSHRRRRCLDRGAELGAGLLAALAAQLKSSLTLGWEAGRRMKGPVLGRGVGRRGVLRLPVFGPWDSTNYVVGYDMLCPGAHHTAACGPCQGSHARTAAGKSSQA